MGDLDPIPYPRRERTTDSFNDVLATFNRDLSNLNESANLIKDVRQLCDNLRDVYLFDKGIYLEDREDQSALIRPVTNALKAAKAEKEDRARQKQMAKEARDKDAKAKADKGSLSHKEMFRTEEFSAWDEEGVPTHENNGDEVTKSKRKKLIKDFERQKKLHETWLKSNSST